MDGNGASDCGRNPRPRSRRVVQLTETAHANTESVTTNGKESKGNEMPTGRHPALKSLNAT